MKFDHERLHRDITKKLNAIKKPQSYLSKKQGFSRACLHRINHGHQITMQTFMKILEWLDEEPNRYFKR